MQHVMSELVATQQWKNYDEKEMKVAFDMPQNDAGNVFGGQQGKGNQKELKLPFLVRFIHTTMLHVYNFCKLIFRGRLSRNIYQIISGIRIYPAHVNKPYMGE